MTANNVHELNRPHTLYVMECGDCSNQDFKIIVDRPGKPERIIGLRCTGCEGDLLSEQIEQSFQQPIDKLKELFYDALNKDIKGLMTLLKELNREVDKRI